MNRYKILLAILSGLATFFLSPYGLTSEWGNIAIDIPWAIVFPFLVSIAFGWRYALITAVSGGALYPFYLWFGNGYPCLLTSVFYTLVFVLLSFIGNKSLKKRISSYYLRLLVIFSAVVLAFYIQYEFLFELFISFNPPFWNSESISSLDKEIIMSFFVKDSINILIILLLSTTLLKLPITQKLFLIKTSKISRDNTAIFLTSVLIAIVIWLIFYVLAKNVIPDEGHKQYHYFTLAFYIIVFSNLLVSRVVMEYSERNLQSLITISESENLLRSLINTIPDLVWVKDKDGVYLKCNKRFEKFFGAPESQILGKSDYDYVDKELADFFRMNDLKALNTNAPVKNEEEVVYKNDGHKEILETIKAPLVIGDEVIGILGIGRDITEMKKIEKELIMLNSELEFRVKQKTSDLEALNSELNITNDELSTKNSVINSQNIELKSALKNLKDTQLQLIQSEKMASLGILTAGVAHEINNPLNFIMAAYVGLKRHFEKIDFSEKSEEIEKLLQALKTGVERSSAIVKGLNHFTRASKSYDENCDIRIIIDNCLTMLQNQTKHRIEVKKHFISGDLTIKGNEGHLHQVFLNIIDNAVQSIESEGAIHIEAENTGQTVIVKVTDTGSGIDSEIIDKIMDPFFTTKDPGKGTGLGLAVTYNIITEHKGTIKFQSEVGKGTSVELTLPRSL